jgi:2,3-bisphosphoglycerate-dependent phosphoglycerate mutase
MTRLLLVRHGQSEWNAAGRIQGQIDIQLDETGCQQAQLIADRLAAEPVAAVYSSPLLRAKSTAEAIADRFHLPVQLDPRLMEYDFGVISGSTWTDVVENHPEFASRWLEDPWAVPVAGSEGRVNFAARVMSAVQDILAQHPAEQVAVVAHGGTFGVYLTAMLGLDLNRRHPFHFGNTSLSLVEVRDDAFHIHYLNNTCHLLDGRVR